MLRAGRVWCLARGQVAVLALLTLTAGAALAESGPKRTVAFSQVEQVVTDHFRSLPGYRPGAIISRSQVEAAFKRLDRIGWPVADRNAILQRVPSDDEWLVRELRTPNGQKFAARIAEYPQGYDRVDRLSRLAHGRQTVHDLVRGPGGEWMIDYMTRSRGGKEMGKMLSKAPNGAGFNTPTGRIYTLGALLEELKKGCEPARQAEQ